MTLQSVDPGSHTISATIVDSLTSIPSPPSFTYFENVLLPEEGGKLGSGRLMSPRLHSHPGICKGTCTSSAERKSSSDDSVASRRRRIKIMFVGMMKFDGQKTIWLHQFKHLPPSKFELQFNTFMELEKQPHPEQMLNALKENNVPLVVHPLPAVGVDALRDTPDLDFDGLFKDSGGVEMKHIVDCLLKRLERANFVVSDVGPTWARETWKAILSELTDYGADVLVFANAREPTDKLLITAAKVAGIGSIVMELPNLFPKFELTDIDAIVAPSHYAGLHQSIQGKLTERGRENKPSVHVINPAVDTATFRPDGRVWCNYMCRGLGAAEEKSSSNNNNNKCRSPCTTIGFVGRISSEKSPGLFIQAAAKIHAAHPFTRFVVVGDGKFLAYMKSISDVYGVADAIVFAGAKYGEELVEIMRSVDIILNPSLRYESETFCIANLEAMSLGIPVVSFGIGGIGEYLEDDVNGLVVENFDEKGTAVDGLVNATLKIVADAEHRSRLGRGALETVQQGGFEIKDLAASYATLYEDLVQRAGEDARLSQRVVALDDQVCTAPAAVVPHLVLASKP